MTHDDLAVFGAELRSEMAELRADVRVELGAMENRLQRSMITWILAAQGVTWILAAQGVTLATLGALVTVLALVLA